MVVQESISRNEYFSVSRKLEQYHAVFYKLWELGKPIFDDRIPTASVAFDKKGNWVEFRFNPDFWRNISETKRCFVICHECLHVILNHGIRMKDAEGDQHRLNQALDLVVNHILLSKYGFKRQDIDPENIYCWVDTVFPNQKVPDNQCFEYYFNRIPEGKNEKLVIVDIHDTLDGSESGESIKRLNRELTDEEKNKLKDMIQKHFQKKKEEEDKQDYSENVLDDLKEVPAGSEAGNLWNFVPEKEIKKKAKWESVIIKWSRKFLRDEFDTVSHWLRVNRRLTEMPDEVVLPTEMEMEDKPDKGKVDVYFFIDASGSCGAFADRFFYAAESLPTRRFNVSYFCFDIRVYELDIKKRKLSGYGGTRFDILEKQIQDDLQNKKIKKYPDGIFVLTDGMAGSLVPVHPERWNWLITEHGSKKSIPKKSKIFSLSDFE